MMFNLENLTMLIRTATNNKALQAIILSLIEFIDYS